MSFIVNAFQASLPFLLLAGLLIAPRHPRYGGKVTSAHKAAAKILLVLGALFGVFAALWMEHMPATFNWL